MRLDDKILEAIENNVNTELVSVYKEGDGFPVRVLYNAKEKNIIIGLEAFYTQEEEDKYGLGGVRNHVTKRTVFPVEPTYTLMSLDELKESKGVKEFLEKVNNHWNKVVKRILIQTTIDKASKDEIYDMLKIIECVQPDERYFKKHFKEGVEKEWLEVSFERVTLENEHDHIEMCLFVKYINRRGVEDWSSKSSYFVDLKKGHRKLYNQASSFCNRFKREWNRLGLK